MKNKIITVVLILFSFTVCYAQDYNINWIEVQGGKFIMGTSNSASEITLSSFYICATEITFDQYDAYCKATGIEFPEDNGWKRGNRPVINVSWDDAIGFCQWLSKETESKVRLPNEAEWEYAAVGGSKSKGYTYSGSDNWKEVSWSIENSDNKTQPVGSKKPNELGLYDMSGNVWEWCADLPVSEEKKSHFDLMQSDNDVKHALKGDSFDNPASNPRLPAARIDADARHYNIGFRVVKTK